MFLQNAWYVAGFADEGHEVTWTAPGNMHLRVGATPHLTSPETSTTAHYWYWSIRHFAISAQANAQIRKFIEFAFSEQDKPMLEAQQRAMRGQEFWSLKPLLLATDGGGGSRAAQARPAHAAREPDRCSHSRQSIKSSES